MAIRSAVTTQTRNGSEEWGQVMVISKRGQAQYFSQPKLLLRSTRSIFQVIFRPRPSARSGFTWRPNHLLDLRVESAVSDRLILIHREPDAGYRILFDVRTKQRSVDMSALVSASSQGKIRIE